MTIRTCEEAINKLVQTALGHSRVYPLRAPQNATTPFVVYQRINSDRWRSVNAPSGVAQVTMQIDVYANTFTDCKNESAKIEDALDGFRGNVTYGSPTKEIYLKGVSFQNDTDLMDKTDEPFLYRNSSTYLVTHANKES
jgi:hypothetical protein